MSASATTPVDADFATFSDVHLGSLAIVLVLTGELYVLELVKHFRYTCGGLGQHRLNWHAHHKRHMLLQLLQSERGLRGVEGEMVREGVGGTRGRGAGGTGGRRSRLATCLLHFLLEA